MGYQKILLPVSGKLKGERALKALQHVLKLTKSEIVVMHAYEPLSMLVGGHAHEELAREAMAEGIRLTAPVIGAIEKASVPHRVRIVEGTPAEAIVHVAHEENCDLIVMFTDGCDDISDLLLGSVTERVLRATDVPLLVVRR